MLRVNSPAQHSLNTVFPFATNWTIFLLAGFFELLISVTCLRYRGRDQANAGLFGFVLVMVWYRWALGFTGGERTCHCLGILGQALHLSKTEEKVIPILVLCLFSLMVIPWAVRTVAETFYACRKRIIGRAAAFTILFSLVSLNSYAESAIRIAGQYNAYYYNPLTGDVHTNRTRHAAFTVILSGKQRSIFVTNTAVEGEGKLTPWEGVVFDGTNTYTFLPEYRSGRGTRYPVKVTVSPGPLFIRDFDEWLDIEVPWMTYGLNPRDVPTNDMGIVEIPLPWYDQRHNPSAYGDEWKIVASGDERFMSYCEMVGNTNLDLTLEKELLRPTLNYPASLGTRNRYAELIGLRRDQIPQGFVEARYKCDRWLETNGFTVPMASEFARYVNVWATNHFGFTAELKASSVSVQPGSRSLLADPTAKTFVADYRYRREDGNRVSPSVEYVVGNGDSWKSAEDPELLRLSKLGSAEAADLSYASDRKRSHLAWLVLAVLSFPLLLKLGVYKNNTETQSK